MDNPPVLIVGAVLIFPIKPGVSRLFCLRTNLDDRSVPTLDEIQSHVDDAGLSHLRLSEPEWLSYFAVNERVASRNRVGRIFLLGDASHFHSPAGGQGMNTGMQDAFNLGWKLKMLTSGRGDEESIAESYFEERHPVAEKVVRDTSAPLP
jgi:2-polyprenyl-6-methoxyphenol hydroxylase-like FAD-dependent oxidoreductase